MLPTSSGPLPFTSNFWNYTVISAGRDHLAVRRTRSLFEFLTVTDGEAVRLSNVWTEGVTRPVTTAARDRRAPPTSMVDGEVEESAKQAEKSSIRYTMGSGRNCEGEHAVRSVDGQGATSSSPRLAIARCSSRAPA